jgi:Phage integrase family
VAAGRLPEHASVKVAASQPTKGRPLVGAVALVGWGHVCTRSASTAELFGRPGSALGWPRHVRASAACHPNRHAVRRTDTEQLSLGSLPGSLRCSKRQLGSVQPSQKGRQKKKPKKAPGGRYSVESFNRAIAKACKTAGVPVWHANQLRHTHATAVRKRFELEAAQAVLGHAKADVTQVYSERDLDLAVKMAREIG